MPTSLKDPDYEKNSENFAEPIKKARNKARLIIAKASVHAAELMEQTMKLTKNDKKNFSPDILRLRFDAAKEVAKAAGAYSDKEAAGASSVVITVTGAQATKIENFAKLTEGL
jgi:hypothetical protein